MAITIAFSTTPPKSFQACRLRLCTEGQTLEVFSWDQGSYRLVHSLGEEDHWDFMDHTLVLAELFAPLS
jgi:hypothetical protein